MSFFVPPEFLSVANSVANFTFPKSIVIAVARASSRRGVSYNLVRLKGLHPHEVEVLAHGWYHFGAVTAKPAELPSEVVRAEQAALWIHGHSHDRCDYLLGTTRVVANPLGYPNEPRSLEAFEPAFQVAGQGIASTGDSFPVDPGRTAAVRPCR